MNAGVLLLKAWTAMGGHLWGLVAILACLVVLAFSSLSEAILMRVELSRVRHLEEEGRRGSKQLAGLVGDRQEVLSSLILLINVAVIVASAYVTEITISLSGQSTRWVPFSSAGMIAFLLVVCEVAPKTYGVRRVEAAGLAIAPVLRVVHAAVRPLGRVLHRISTAFNRRVLVPVIGGNVTPQAPLFSDEEVLEIVSAGEAAGSIEEDEKEMIHGVMEFADKVVREVMTPRTDMVCLAYDDTLADAARVCQETGYSRLPVYEDTLDHVIGIAYAKDMVSALQAKDADAVNRPSAGAEAAGREPPRLRPADRPVGDIARKPPPVVPESKRLDEALALMQRNRLHMAVVIDEYGGTAGLVTIEDLLEEIFGEIQDEYDLEAPPVQEVGEQAWMIDAKLSADEVAEVTGVELPEGDFDSVGGFILDQLGRLPVVGETVRWQSLEFTVNAVSENRIRRLLMIRRAEEGGGPDGAAVQ